MLLEGEKKSVGDTEVMQQLRAEWEMMSEEEQEEFTRDRVQQLQEDRKVKTIGTHTVAANAFQDASQTIVKVEDTVRDTITS